MAFSNSTSDRMDELRFRSQQSPRNESSMSFAALTSPIRTGRLPPPSSTHDGGRMNLTRRFTTDSGRVPTITSIASQRTIQALESLDFPPSVGIISSLPQFTIPIVITKVQENPPNQNPHAQNEKITDLFFKNYHKVQLVSPVFILLPAPDHESLSTRIV